MRTSGAGAPEPERDPLGQLAATVGLEDRHSALIEREAAPVTLRLRFGELELSATLDERAHHGQPPGVEIQVPPP